MAGDPLLDAASTFDAVILAGGAATRLDGADKPALLVGGRSLLQRALDAVAGARRVVVVGPPRAEPGVSSTIRWCQEQPPGGGPVAALAAGLPECDASTVLLLAADLPWAGDVVPALLSALAREPSADAALLSDNDGRPNYLAAAWQRVRLSAALHRSGRPAGLAARTLYDGVSVVDVRAGIDVAGHAADDCDTWTDLTRARARAADGG